MPGARCSAISTTFATQPYSLPYPDPVLVAGLCFALAEAFDDHLPLLHDRVHDQGGAAPIFL